MVGIVDASFKQDKKAVGGGWRLLFNKDFTKVSPIYWKIKQIERMCHSSKDGDVRHEVNG